MATQTIQVRGCEFPNAGEALQEWYADPGWDHVILIGGKHICVDREEADRLTTSGVRFAFVHDQEMPDGSYRTMTIPVN